MVFDTSLLFQFQNRLIFWNENLWRTVLFVKSGGRCLPGIFIEKVYTKC